MESEFFKIALKILTETGPLGLIVIILFIMYKRLIERLFKVIDNNTVALTNNANAIKQMYDIVKECKHNK